MTRRELLSRAGWLLGLVAWAPACLVARVKPPPLAKSRGHGPPPHAPAHGYRRKQLRQGVDLVFDAGLGVYVVVGLEDTFFLDDSFYRRRDERWEFASALDGPWRAVGIADLPPGLRPHRGAPPRGRGKKNK